MKKILFSLVLICCVGVFSATAQVSSMKGVVSSSEDGQPLIGVTVTVTGTQRRTITDLDGNFVLDGLQPGDKTITLTCIGMADKTIAIAPEVKVQMDPDSQFIEETIVVAFGKQTKEAFTGSASVVKSEDITKQAVSDPIKALSGKVPGLTIIASNNPASENTINIRGLGSVNAATKPLIIVDGQPFNGSMRDINPADVDNISVLKDAASNALYGARGANGVIMITTKSAQKGSTRVSLDMKWGISTDAQVDYDKIDNPGEYYEAHYLALRNYYTRALGHPAGQSHLEAVNTMCGTSSADGGLGYIVYTVPEGESLIGSNGKFNPNATLGSKVYSNGKYYTLLPDDWKKEGLRNGFRQEYNLNVSGGREGFSIYASIGALLQNGITYGSDLKRTSIRLKTDYQAFKWLHIGGTASYSHSAYDNLYSTYSDVYSIAPIYPLYLRDENGEILQDTRGNRYDYGDATIGFYRQTLKNTNSIQSDRIDTYKTDSNSFGFNGFANFDLPWGLQLSITGSIYIREYRNNEAYNPYYGYYNTTQGYVSTSHSRQTTENYQQLLTWRRTFGKHNIDLLAGHEYMRQGTAALSGTKSMIAMFDQNIELSGAVIDKTSSGSRTLYNVEGWLARAQYDYDGRYYASASFRRDASSRFHPDHRWGNFWSVGGAWILSKEPWFPKTRAVNMLKFKASFGEQGNDGLSSPYYWTDFYNITNSNNQVAYTFSWKGNPDITWETGIALNTGFEFNLLGNRLNGGIDFYNRKTTDMLYFKTVSASMGYNGYYDNIGDMVNRGVEVTLDGLLVNARNFTWGLNLNFSYEKNHISYLPETSKRSKLDGHWGYPGSYYFYGEGLPLYTWYIPRYAGPDANGRPSYYVIDADGNETTTTEYSAATNFNCGTALPDMYGGFGTSLTLFGVDISANFNFTIGGKKLDSGYSALMGSPYSNAFGSNIHRDALRGWSETNTDSMIPRWQFGDSQNNMVSDFYLTSGSQLTLQNIQVGYTLPKNALQKMHMSSLRINLSCDGVAYWTARKGFDPRTVRAQYGGTGYGAMRTYLLGLNVQF